MSSSTLNILLLKKRAAFIFKLVAYSVPAFQSMPPSPLSMGITFYKAGLYHKVLQPLEVCFLHSLLKSIILASFCNHCTNLENSLT